MKAAYILFAVLLTGCGKWPGPASVTVEEHTLPDGTRCAVAVSQATARGLSCDWQPQPTPAQPIPEAARAVIVNGRVQWAEQ